jgi:hypothetical protein
VTGVTAFAGIPWVPSHALLLLVGITVPVTGWWFAREVLPSQTTDGVMTRRVATGSSGREAWPRYGT